MFCRVFSRNRSPTSTLECALPRVLMHKLFRMRSSEKSGGMGYSRRSLFPKSFPCHRSETPGGNLASAANLKVYALSLAGACEPAWAYLPMLSFQLSIEDPDPVGTVDCQPPVPLFHRSLSKESFTTLLHSIACAPFPKTAGCTSTLVPN